MKSKEIPSRFSPKYKVRTLDGKDEGDGAQFSGSRYISYQKQLPHEPIYFGARNDEDADGDEHGRDEGHLEDVPFDRPFRNLTRLRLFIGRDRHDRTHLQRESGVLSDASARTSRSTY